MPDRRGIVLDVLLRGEGQEEMLADRFRAQQHHPVQLRGIGEPALRARGAHPLPAEGLREGGGQPMDGVTLGHYSVAGAADCEYPPVRS